MFAGSQYGVKARGLMSRYGDQLGRQLENQRAADALRLETERRLMTEGELGFLATHDVLTRLPNRTLLMDMLARELRRCREDGSRLASLQIEITQLKEVRSLLGHPAGDALLRAIAQRLAGCLAERDLLAWIGDDSFAIVIPGPADEHALARLGRQLIDAVMRPFDLLGRPVFVGAVVGIALAPENGMDAEALQACAAVAAARAKGLGRGVCQFFDGRIDAEIRRETQLEQALHGALAAGELTLVYQPQVSYANGLITGVEALLRWTHPTFGPIPPEEFIPLAERSGAINEIGAWVLRESCVQVLRWESAGLPPLNMAVNVAAPQFKDTDLHALVKRTLAETGLAPSRLELEITETGLMNDLRSSTQKLADLRALGVTLAIDDFGTGYSSLNYLRSLPVDRLKIDKSFVTDVVSNAEAATIATTIVTLGRNLRLDTIAEGVETAAHADFVRGISCGAGQGYHYSRPCTPEQMIEVMRTSPFGWRRNGDVG